MRRPSALLALAVLAAAAAALLVYSALQHAERRIQSATLQSVEIVVAAKDLAVGSKLDRAALKLVRWPRDSLPAGVILNPDAIVDRSISGAVAANEPILRPNIFDADRSGGVLPMLIPTGMRAMSVEVDEVTGIAGFVLPHARVDVLLATAPSDSIANGRSFSQLVLQNAEVLAVGQETESRAAAGAAKVVTLLVTPQQAEQLALASREGTLRLALRGYNDSAIVATGGTDVQAIIDRGGHLDGTRLKNGTQRKAAAAEKPFEVEVVRNGKSHQSVSFVNDQVVRDERPAEQPTGPAASAITAAAMPLSRPEPGNPLDKVPNYVGEMLDGQVDHAPTGKRSGQ